METNTCIKVVIFGFVMFGKVLVGMINDQFCGDFQTEHGMELYDLSHMRLEMKWTIDGLSRVTDNSQMRVITHCC